MRSLGIPLLALIAACASPPKNEDLSRAAVCCSSVADMKFRPLSPSTDEAITIDAQSPAFGFSEGKSYFIALKLPSSSSSRTLSLKTFLSSGVLPMASVFIPRLMILGDDLRESRVESDLRFNSGVHFFSGGYFAVDIPLKTGDTYVVVYADASRIGQTTTFASHKTGFAYAAGNTVAFSPGGTSIHEIPIAAGGKIEVAIR